MKLMLQNRMAAGGVPPTELVGPAPAFYQKLRGRFRWQIMVRSCDPAMLLRDLRLSRGWTVDIDPIGLG